MRGTIGFWAGLNERTSPDEYFLASRKLYTPLIYYWACWAGLFTHDAADLVQDVMIVLVRKVPTPSG